MLDLGDGVGTVIGTVSTEVVESDSTSSNHSSISFGRFWGSKLLDISVRLSVILAFDPGMSRSSSSFGMSKLILSMLEISMLLNWVGMIRSMVGAGFWVVVGVMEIMSPFGATLVVALVTVSEVTVHGFFLLLVGGLVGLVDFLFQGADSNVGGARLGTIG